ncbi:hypothetical protein [Arthrobacter sp. MMS18-M83]|uniref:hypothetical protein n=1 Tax=Arthrobacter sp. MMS18-M83 TaxID=2996261 RepID=UPI00227BDA8C|nr:hypothetical protein [Arthrobacter sp. MMS18-M83]WAH95516.1 hypothetical protein OW521_13760 [Arthrobacter sp. MMS18-M83]
MAIIHRATLRPSKLELIEKYLPAQTWFTNDGSAPPSSGTPGSEVPVLSPGAPITQDTITSIDAGELTLLVNRVLDLGTQGSDAAADLRGTWADQSSPVLLATLPQA